MKIINPKRPFTEIVREFDVYFRTPEGLIKPIPYQLLKRLDRNELEIYMNRRGIYCLVTFELIALVKSLIGKTRKAIEIGSGNGTLGRSLGIATTDSRLQEETHIKAHYALIGQPVIKYPDDIEKLDGISALKKHKPDVCVGAWVTAHSDEPGQGNFYGVKEAEILEHCEEYIFIGSEFIVGHELSLFNMPDVEVKVYRSPYIVSRVEDGNFIAVFRKKQNS